MEYKSLAGGTKIPVLGLGTWQMGGGWNTPGRAKDDQDIQAIQEAIKLGVTHIDTAELYGGGHAEELVGHAIKPFKRNDLFITTKVLPSRRSSDEVLKAAESSLKRLQTDYIDLYLLHWREADTPLDQVMKAMNQLVRQKVVRFIGVSNFSTDDIEEAQQFSKEKIVANQVEYNLLSRDNGDDLLNVESEVIPYCLNNKILIIAHRPLVLGQLTRKGAIPLLDEIADKYHKTPAQIALNWLISKPGIVAIPKASRLEHLKENLGALGWQMEEADLKRLDALPGAA